MLAEYRQMAAAVVASAALAVALERVRAPLKLILLLALVPELLPLQVAIVVMWLHRSTQNSKSDL